MTLRQSSQSPQMHTAKQKVSGRGRVGCGDSPCGKVASVDGPHQWPHSIVRGQDRTFQAVHLATISFKMLVCARY